VHGPRIAGLGGALGPEAGDEGILAHALTARLIELGQVEFGRPVAEIGDAAQVVQAVGVV
jgi:hypothetical protein